MPELPNLYLILQVPETATQAEIKSAFYKLCHQYHPDKVPGHSTKLRQDAEEKFKRLKDAYDILSHPQKRKQYDAALRDRRARD